MARLKGLEPLALCLEGRCSIQLSYRRTVPQDMERVMGIEPTRPAWKAGVLPLNYTRTYVTASTMIAHSRIPCQEPFCGFLPCFCRIVKQIGQRRNEERQRERAS